LIALAPDATGGSAQPLDAGGGGSASDARGVTPPDAYAAAMMVDAAAVPVVDAAAVPVVDGQAEMPADAMGLAVDAGAPAAPDAGVDPNQQAKNLMQEAHEANQEGDFEKALALANSSLKLRRTARAYIVRAQALQRLDRIDDALESVDSAEGVAPDYASVFEARGSILWAAGRWDEARTAYDRFLQLEPDSARANQIRRRLAEPH
jgi:tetratricopeptide (TPR) repeat protein